MFHKFTCFVNECMAWYRDAVIGVARLKYGVTHLSSCDRSCLWWNISASTCQVIMLTCQMLILAQLCHTDTNKSMWQVVIIISDVDSSNEFLTWLSNFCWHVRISFQATVTWQSNLSNKRTMGSCWWRFFVNSINHLTNESRQNSVPDAYKFFL